MPDDNAPAPDVTAPTLPPVEGAVSGVAGAGASADMVAPDGPTASAGVVAPDGPTASADVVPPASASEPTPEPASSVVVDPVLPAADAPAADDTPNTEILAEVAKKISDAHNVLIALSSNPSVDEMAAAIGLSLYLDRLGKRATAIYSGQTPNALEFLKPEETFEPSVDTLQDFVIALNKDKADHLRYKLDGDYVKIYITPYKSRVGEEDLEFSYGDYNVDLVLALDVANGVDLDSALREHGRIMHDAVIVNVTTGNPGKLGEIEWSNKKASSVSEMIATLLYSVKSKIKIEKEEATAFLTGIVAATNRFANAGTTSETMRVASRLVDSGANQQLVSKNITPDIDNELFGMSGTVGALGSSGAKSDGDPTKLDIAHGNEEGVVDESKVVDDAVTEKESTLLDDLKAAEASLAAAEMDVTPEKSQEPLKIESEPAADGGETAAAEPAVAAEPATITESAMAAEPAPATEVAPTTSDSATTTDSTTADSAVVAESGDGDEVFVSDKPEKVLQPLGDLSGPGLGTDTEKYGQMLEDALASVDNTVPAMPTMPAPAVEPMPTPVEMPAPTMDAPAAAPVVSVGAPVDNVEPVGNPAAMGAPAVPANPEINGVPEINYMPMPGDEVLPPPPAPPIDMSAPAPAEAAAPAMDVNATSDGAPVVESTPVMPAVEPTPVTPVMPAVEPVVASEPVATPEPTATPASDPGAFKIPGM